MEILELILAVVGGYLLGSFPSGLVYVRLFTGKDVRTFGSGRTGGTNAMRAGGFWVGFLTAMSDILKGALAVWLAQWLLPAGWVQEWGMVLSGLASILGHNYPVWLNFKGGAGGATCAGAAIGFWPWMLPIVFIEGAIILYFVGYASVATILTALTVTGVLAYLAYLGVLSWTFVWFGVGATLLLAYALRPNFARLMKGEERLVGLRAKRKAAREAAGAKN